MKYQLVELFGKWTVVEFDGIYFVYWSFVDNLFLDSIYIDDLTDKPTAEKKLKELENEK